MANLRELLKAETMQSHHQMEETMDLTSDQWNLASYCSLLDRFYRLHTALEKQIKVFPELSVYYQDRHKSDLLARDLENFNCALSTQESAMATQFFAGLTRAAWWAFST